MAAVGARAQSVEANPGQSVFGWAAVNGLGRSTTTGGAGGKTVVAKTASEFSKYAKKSEALTIRLTNSIQGSFSIASNKTILGENGATIRGHLEIAGRSGSYASNVILKNLKIIGWNCADVSAPNGCRDGADAVTVVWTHHIWVDHCDISDGSDGNLDMTHAVDFATVSWTRFSYSSTKRDHRFSNLIGGDDANGKEDTGHLNITFAYNWWVSNVDQRMPRTRFG